LSPRQAAKWLEGRRAIHNCTTRRRINLIHGWDLAGQRADGGLSIAVDPHNSATVYIAWTEVTGGNIGVLEGQFVLHLQMSTDGGHSWVDLLGSLVNAINPSVAVNEFGEVGFSYQQLTGTKPNERWQTHMMVSPVSVFFPLDVILADMPAVTDPTGNNNPLGDYDNLLGIGRTFYGIFAGWNEPVRANFPQGLPSYQRNADFDAQELTDTNGGHVDPSIDPFFFKLAVPLRQSRIPVFDFDGDGRTDFAAWRASVGAWTIVQSSTGNAITQWWGGPGDIPVAGDFDGDGKADYAVWSVDVATLKGTWWVLGSTGGQVIPRPQVGVAGDIPVAGDFDGDGKTDYAVWSLDATSRQGTWKVLASSGTLIPDQVWGVAGDIPLPGDYNGDGKDEFAVWHPSDATWNVMAIFTGAQISQQVGMQGDMPAGVPAWYVLAFLSRV
jgi:hypothetical protein